MLVVAEPYFRFAEALGPTKLERAATELLGAVVPVVRKTYAETFEGFPFSVAVRVERGSTKVWVTVSGVAGALVFYGSIRQSIDYLIADAKRVAASVLPIVAPAISLKTSEPAYREQRVGVPGQLHRLFEQVERHEISAEEATQRAVDAFYKHGGPQTIQEAPGLLESISREFRETRSRPSENRRRRRSEKPYIPMLAMPVEPIAQRRRSGVLAVHDPVTVKESQVTFVSDPTSEAGMARTAEILPAGMRLTDHISLGVLTAQFPRALVERMLAETSRQSVRERALPAHVMVYYVIALGLYAEVSTQEVLRPSLPI